MSSYFEATRKLFQAACLGTALFYLSGCTNVPGDGIINQQDTHRLQERYSSSRLIRIQSHQERYDSERRAIKLDSNDKIDLLNHIDKDFISKAESIKKSLDASVEEFLPRNTKITSDGIVWTKKY